MKTETSLDNKLFYDVKNTIIKHFGPKQIMSILVYGNRINNKKHVDQHSDYDVTIVFKNYPHKNLPLLPPNINLTTLYWPDIKLSGVKNFRLYNHGEFYIIVLSEAKTIHGINPFNKLKMILPKSNILSSLREQVFLHCSKLAAITLEPESLIKKRNICKYSFRIAQNFYFLKNQHVNYKEFTNKSRNEWVSIFMKNMVLSPDLIKYLIKVNDVNKSIKNMEVFNYIHTIKSKLLKTHE